MSIVLSKLQNRIGYIRMNRPEKRNALNPELVFELKKAIRNFLDSSECKVMVLEAEGEAFCAGADLEYLIKLQNNSFEENLVDSKNLAELFELIYLSRKPIIASIQGHALAGGCGLASICDISIASSEAKFGYTEVKIGFVPAIVSVFLIKKIGEAACRNLLLTGNLIQAESAMKLGLITDIANPTDLKEKVDQLASQLCEQTSAQSLAYTKQLLAHFQHPNLNEELDFAAQLNAEARSTDDCKKGISAFISKTKITW